MKVFVIHYSKLVERKQHILDQFQKQNITNFEFVEKYNQEDLQPADLQLFQGLKKSVISLLLKHFHVYKFIAESHQHALILEDDVVLAPNFVDLFKKYTQQLPQTYDLLFLGNGCNLHIEKKSLIPGRHVYRKGLTPTSWGGNGATRCTDSYMISQKCAARLCAYLKTLQRIQLPSDWWLNEACRDNHLEVYWAEPTIVSQGTESGLFKSSI